MRLAVALLRVDFFVFFFFLFSSCSSHAKIWPFNGMKIKTHALLAHCGHKKYYWNRLENPKIMRNAKCDLFLIAISATTSFSFEMFGNRLNVDAFNTEWQTLTQGPSNEFQRKLSGNGLMWNSIKCYVRGECGNSNFGCDQNAVPNIVQRWRHLRQKSWKSQSSECISILNFVTQD